jgi:hypothetical protein
MKFLSLAGVAVLLTLLGCGGGGGSTTPPSPSAPTITAFTATPSSVPTGQTTSLFATFANGIGTIDHGVGQATSGQNITSPAITTAITFTLTVTGQGGTVTSTATVTINPFSTVGSLNTGRSQHTATLLPSGKVLITGGTDSTGGNLTSAEIYDPTTKIFTPTGSMHAAKTRHTATLLGNGTVLIYGELRSPQPSDPEFELYNPATGQFTSSINNSARSAHTATLLTSGKVLIAGGANLDITAALALYDPSTSGMTPTSPLHPQMNSARSSHTATLLTDGRVLLAGGSIYGTSTNAEIYDPTTGTCTVVDTRVSTRSDHAATILPNGSVLVAGGFAPGGGNPLATAEIFNPGTSTFTPTGSLTFGMQGFHLVLLSNGTVIAPGFAPMNIYNPSTGVFTAIPAKDHGRGSTATFLQDGSLLIVGGDSAPTTAETYQ